MTKLHLQAQFRPRGTLTLIELVTNRVPCPPSSVEMLDNRPIAALEPKINVRQRGISGDLTGCMAGEYCANQVAKHRR